MSLRSITLSFVLLVFAVGCGGRGGRSGDGGGSGGSDPGGPGVLSGADIRLNTDDAGAQLSLFPEICCNGQTLYVVWYDRRDGGLDVYFNVSRNAGRDWLGDDVRLDTDDAGSANSNIPRICCDGDRVYVVWHDDRNGENDVYFNRSLDGGRSWLTNDVRLDTDDAGAAGSREPRICCDGDTVFVAWHDDRDGSWAVRGNRSVDAGSNWLDDDLALDRGDTTSDAFVSDLCCSGPSVHVLFTDNRDEGVAVYSNSSTDGGATWGTNDRRLDRSSGPGEAEAPVVACEGAVVVVAWADSRDGERDIFVNRSSNSGTGWLAGPVRVDRDLPGAGDSTLPDLCLSGGRAYLAWQDERGASTDIYFSRSLDGGATWDLIDTRLDQAPSGLDDAVRPRICCAGDRLTVVWRDDRAGRFDVFLRHSLDAGGEWSDPELRMDTDDLGTEHSLDPRVCCGGDRVYVVWYDLRHGPGDIYFNTARFPQ